MKFRASVPKLKKFCRAIASARMTSTDSYSNNIFITVTRKDVTLMFRSTMTRVTYQFRNAGQHNPTTASADFDQFSAAISVLQDSEVLFKIENERLAVKFQGTYVFFDSAFLDGSFYADPVNDASPAFQVGKGFFRTLQDGVNFAKSGGTHLYFFRDRMLVPHLSNFMVARGRFPSLVLTIQDAKRLSEMFSDSETKAIVFKSDNFWYFTNRSFGYSCMAQEVSRPYHANLQDQPKAATGIESTKFRQLLRYLDSPGFSEDMTIAVGAGVTAFINRASHGDEPCGFTLSNKTNPNQIPAAAQFPVQKVLHAQGSVQSPFTIAIEGNTLYLTDGRRTVAVFGKPLR